MIVISDTSPITNLLQINQIELLQQLYQEVVLPEAVRAELSILHSSLPGFFLCVPVANRGEVDRLKAELDAGEAEAIVLAKEKQADLLLIDEVEGRRVALREGVPFIGLLGVLVQAKRAGHIKSLLEIIRQLESETTFHLSDKIKALALQSAGES